MALTETHKEQIKDIHRLISLDAQAYSKTGVTLDESIERNNLVKKYHGISMIETLIHIIEDLSGERLL